ncbi:hypothetical protein [Cellulosimicrobium cellulans]|uniref:hypothetical protein n=1 Tax=Cellulosimicrobium cellulans TaxID=1710 RepID=UPI00130DBD38|nr:hypothetical protein [Cellulosimicrobium cellulans]
MVDDLGEWIPESWSLWLLGASASTAALAAAVAKIMAIPAVDAWLSSFGLGSAPAGRPPDTDAPAQGPG